MTGGLISSSTMRTTTSVTLFPTTDTVLPLIEIHVEKDRPHLSPDFGPNQLAEMLGVSMTRLYSHPSAPHPGCHRHVARGLSSDD